MTHVLGWSQAAARRALRSRGSTGTYNSYLSRRNRTSNKLLYPLATEPPEIAETQASEAAEMTSTTNFKPSVPLGDDPFRDGQSLPQADINKIREDQEKKLSTSLSSLTLPIEATAPAHVPPNVPSNQLEKPVSQLTTLDNGIRVVSQETYGQVTAIGVVSQVGSRFEQESEVGASSTLETLGFGTSANLGSFQISQLLQDWGGTPFVNVGREQALHCVDLLRPNAENAVALMAEALQRPQFLPEEIEDVQRTMQFQAENLPPELLLSEGIQQAAYGPDQSLGKVHFPTLDMPPLSPSTVEGFWRRQFLENSRGIVVGAAGIQHDQLVEHVNKYFGHLPRNEKKIVTTPVEYKGGQFREVRPYDQTLEEKDLVRVAICLPTEGWHGKDLVAACVLQTLLGGGMSFSAGGPGKGMYSRLYRQVLNRYHWAESSEAFTAFHEDVGLWGISASSPPQYARDMTLVVADHLLALGMHPVSEDELSRARKMLKNNVLTQLESRLVLFEDLSRQILTYGHREEMSEVCRKIDAITAEDIKAFVKKSLQSPPSLAVLGSNLDSIPDHAEVAGWFASK